MKIRPELKCRLIGGETKNGFCEIRNDYLPFRVFCDRVLKGNVTKDGICRFPLNTFETLPKYLFDDLQDLERDRKHKDYVQRHCPEIIGKTQELIEEYGMERPPASIADVFAESMTVVKKTPKGLKVIEGKHHPVIRNMSKRLADDFTDRLINELNKDKKMPNIKKRHFSGERRKRKPYSENYILYQICRLKEEMEKGRTGSMAQQQRHKTMKRWIYALAHPEERDMPFVYGKHYW